MPGVVHLSITVMQNAPLRGVIPSVDPAGAKPRRDHRFLDRVSRHEVPKTPEKNTSVKIDDPARVSHLPVRQSVRHPSGVVGSFAMPDPRVVGATPLDPGLKSGHPYRGAPRLGDPHPLGYGGAQVSRWHDGTCKECFIHHSSR